MKEQRQELGEVDQRFNRTKEKLKEMQSFDGGIEQHIKKLEEEAKTNIYISEKLPQVIQENDRPEPEFQ